LEGNLEVAARKITEAAALVQAEIPDYVRQEVVAQQVCVYLAQNRPTSARMALQGQGFSFEDGFAFPVFPLDQGVSHSLGLLANSSLRFLLYQAQTRGKLTGLEPGIDLASRLIEGAHQSQSTVVVLEALLLRAQMHAALGDHRASQSDYLSALELAEPEGFIGIFIEQGQPIAEALANLARQNQLGTIQPGYVERILAAFSDSSSPGDMHDEEVVPELLAGSEPLALIDPLTDRELEVLGLMAEGLKYKEIAARLVVSLNTVRYHVKAIYGKLNVNNRTQAIETARQHQIL